MTSVINFDAGCLDNEARCGFDYYRANIENCLC